VVELGCHFLLSNVPATAPERDIEQTVATLLHRSHTRPRSADERRTHQREAYTERIEVSGVPGLGTQVAFARDLSKGGLSFISTAPLPLDQCLVALPHGAQGPVRLQVRIVRW